MTHDELLARLELKERLISYEDFEKRNSALRAVVELHKPKGVCSDPDCKPMHDWCSCGMDAYPCPTIQAIEKELK